MEQAALDNQADSTHRWEHGEAWGVAECTDDMSYPMLSSYFKCIQIDSGKELAAQCVQEGLGTPQGGSSW